MSIACAGGLVAFRVVIRVWRLFRPWSIVGVAMIVAGCATVPMGDSHDDSILKSFPTRAAVAGLYIYREQALYASAVAITVDVDGNPIGQTAIKTYLYTEVPPGLHTISSRSIGPHVPDSIEIQTVAGRNYFILQDMVLNLAALQTKLRLVGEAEGKRGVLATNLAQSTTRMPAMPQAPMSPTAPPAPRKGDPTQWVFESKGPHQSDPIKWLFGSKSPRAKTPSETEGTAAPAPTEVVATLPSPAAALPTVAPPPTPAQPSPRKVALVIGNGAYREAPLKNPRNDARAIAGKLGALGFEVMLGEDLGLREMTRLITRFGEKAAGTGVGMFFYAGHGMQVKGRNYLLPVDAQITSEASARSESVDLDQILDQLSGSGGQFSLVVLDACRNNPFERRFRGSGGGLAQVDAPKGTLIAYATAPGRVALDGDGENSTYTTALLRALDEPGLPVESVFKRVRGDVSRSTGDQQVPWESSSLTGDFFFRPMAGTIGGRFGSDTERLFWQSIRESRDAEDFRAYLGRYPNGQFSEIARNRIKRLTGK
jgi:hypothetical protein